jgi:hypothetical protein
MLDGAIFCPKARRVAVEPFAAGELLEDVADNGSVGMELGNMTPDILLSRVSQKIEFGLVGSQDNAFATNDMKADSTVFEEILKVTGFAPKLILHCLVRRDVLEAIDRALYVAAVILQGANINQRSEAFAVRPLYDDLGIPDRGPDADRIGHRAIFGWKRRAVGQK